MVADLPAPFSPKRKSPGRLRYAPPSTAVKAPNFLEVVDLDDRCHARLIYQRRPGPQAAPVVRRKRACPADDPKKVRDDECKDWTTCDGPDAFALPGIRLLRLSACSAAIPRNGA
jgi:hypothetical protein